ncbi:unnamed protein product, partial [marine sediment metagenome]
MLEIHNKILNFLIFELYFEDKLKEEDLYQGLTKVVNIIIEDINYEEWASFLFKELNKEEIKKKEEIEEECNEFIELRTDQYDIGKYRKYIIGEISNNYFNLFNKFILKRIKKSSKGVNDFLNIYQKSQIRKYECLCTQYNAIYGENLREDELIHSGVLKVLYWISSGNIENSSSDPILVPFLESVVKHLKLKKWRPYKPKVTDFIGSLKENRENSTIKFLIGLMKRDQICDSMLKGHKISSKKGILGFYSNPHSKNIDYG